MRSECKEKYMCGIAGFYNAKGNYQQQKEKWASVLTSMHECLAHRGNDESGIYLAAVGEEVALSQGDLDAGHGAAIVGVCLVQGKRRALPYQIPPQSPMLKYSE